MKTFEVIAQKRNGLFQIQLGIVKAENKKLALKIAKSEWSGFKGLKVQETKPI